MHVCQTGKRITDAKKNSRRQPEIAFDNDIVFLHPHPNIVLFVFHGENRRRTRLIADYFFIVLRIEQDRIWRMQPHAIATVRCLIFAQANIDYRKKCGKVVDSNFSLVLVATEYTILMGIPPAEHSQKRKKLRSFVCCRCFSFARTSCF